MTTMDSDSESQDSDDGRRFRFEATRKDASTLLEAESKTKSSRRKSKRKSHCSDKDYENKKDRSKHESSRKECRTSNERDTDNKDLRHTLKHSRHSHETQRSRHEDRLTHKDHRDGRDDGLSSTNRSSKNSGTKDRIWESKHHRHRDRSEHRKQRSQERCHDKSHEDRLSSDNHRNKSREKYRHLSRGRSRERSHQSHKLKSSDSSRSQDVRPRRNSQRRTSTRENETQHMKRHSSKTAGQVHSDSESQSTLSNDISKTDLSVENQECKDLDLSDFDVLSETDENLSDGSDLKNLNSPVQYHKAKVKKHDSSDQSEYLPKNNVTNNKHLEEHHKVNRRNSDPLPGSSNNNPSTISDFLLGSTSPIISGATKHCANIKIVDFGNMKNHETTGTAISNGKKERTNSEDRSTLYLSKNCVPEAKPVSREKLTSDSCPALLAEIPKVTYGPVLPPLLSDNSDDISKSPTLLLATGQNKNIDRNTELPENRRFIGPCLPSSDILNALNHSNLGRVNELELDIIKEKSMDCDGFLHNSSENEIDSESQSLSFGPALPPHLLQQKHSNSTQNKVIGPALSNINKSCTEDKHSPHSSESEDDDAIGPLPVDHPALRSSDVHKKLEHRAQRIKIQHREEDKDILNKREEWMIELPPAQANNFGLGPRKFRCREGPDMSDRSCWTDTPAKIAEKQKKAEEEKIINSEVPHKVSTKQHSKSESGKSRKREKSLLEIHQSKIQKKKKKEEKDANLTGQSTRRPFDRDIDLKANQLDRAQKKTILMKAQLLDDRFSRGEI